MHLKREAFFVNASPDPSDRRLYIYHPPHGDRFRGCVVHVHAFAEEMNKSRRMVAIQSRALASGGFAVLQHDLMGCGDSSADFGDALWEQWVLDTLRAVEWLRQRHDGPLWLWGMRAGCLVAAQAARELRGENARLLFWQPVLYGRNMLQQWLRLRVAAEISGHETRTTTTQLRDLLRAGHAVDVAGYSLSPKMAAALEAATIEPPDVTTDLVWLEVNTRTPASLLPASSAEVTVWSAAGHRVDAHAVTGPTFWATVGVEDAPALIDATVRALRAVSSP